MSEGGDRDVAVGPAANAHHTKGLVSRATKGGGLWALAGVGVSGFLGEKKQEMHTTHSNRLQHCRRHSQVSFYDAEVLRFLAATGNA